MPTRLRGRPQTQLITPAQSFVDELRDEVSRSTQLHWPNRLYEHDIIGFFKNVLGLQTWDLQDELLLSFQNNQFTAVKAGRRVSKSLSISGIALWMYCTYERGQVVMSSHTADQLNSQLYSELRRMWTRSGICLDCRTADPTQRSCVHSQRIDGVLGQTAKSGLKGRDPAYPRYVIGKVGRTPESTQGWGGPEFAALIDEAALLEDDFLASIEGSLAGGGRILLAANPRKRGNGYHRCFAPGSGYHCLTIPSTATPNYIEGRTVIPGLAGRKWVDEKIAKHGIDSAYVRANILGEFPLDGALGGIISSERIEAAMQLHGTPGTGGVLRIGIDPAGEHDSGRADSTAIAVVRGNRMLDQYVSPGLTAQQILDVVLELLDDHAAPGEVARVQYDAAAKWGWLLGQTLKAHAHAHRRFEAVGIRGLDKALEQRFFGSTRDELADQLDKWIRNGGSLLPDELLAQELAALRWIEPDKQGRQRLVEKRHLEAVLDPRRSPDRYDALSLCVYDTGIGSVREQIERQLSRRAASQQPGRAAQSSQPRRSPSSGRDFWGRGRR